MNLFKRLFRRKKRIAPKGVIIIDGMTRAQFSTLVCFWNERHASANKIHWGGTHTKEQAQRILDDLTALLKELGSEV